MISRKSNNRNIGNTKRKYCRNSYWVWLHSVSLHGVDWCLEANNFSITHLEWNNFQCLSNSESNICSHGRLIDFISVREQKMFKCTLENDILISFDRMEIDQNWVNEKTEPASNDHGPYFLLLAQSIFLAKL